MLMPKRFMSIANWVGVIIVFFAAVVFAVQERWGLAVVMLLGVVFSIGLIWRINRGKAGALTRIMSLEPADERDRNILANSLVVMAYFDIFISLLGSLVIIMFFPGNETLEIIAQLIMLLLGLKLLSFLAAVWIYNRRM